MVIPFARASNSAAVRALPGSVGPAFALSGGVPASRLLHGWLREYTPAAGWAGVTAFLAYISGLVPVQIAVTGRLGLSTEQATSWLCIIWLTGGLASIGLALRFRQPIPVTSSLPAIIYLGSQGRAFSYPELVGASLLAAGAIVVLGLSGLSRRLLVWLPLPITLGMFAGSLVGDLIAAVRAATDDGLVAGLAILAYLAGRALNSRRVPPVGLAVVVGAVALGLGHRTGPAPLSWQLPALHVPPVQFTPAAFVAVSLPLVVLSAGLGTVQGLGFLVSQGYRVPVDRVTVVVGLGSLLNALFGGHPAITSRSGIPIVAGPDAGPKVGRYWASLIAGALSLLIALAAQPLAALLGILPASYVLSVAGLAMLSAFQNALEQAFSGPLRFGALVAFVVAASPVSCWGLPAAVWALVAGFLAALLTERHELLACWRQPPTPCGTSSGAQRA